MGRKRMRNRLTLDLLNPSHGPSPPLTVDRGTSEGTFLTNEQIGPKRHMTKEGFLLCQDVPISRVGWMIYAPHEVPILPGPDGYCMIHRSGDDLFHPDSIASAMGKAVTNNHPLNGVAATNWNAVAKGTAHNPRRGVGDWSDVILCDLLITDAETIKAVLGGKVEVSAGYEADYEQTGMGTGRQLNIIFNHIALVERGRCGPRCAIGDQSTTQTQPPKGAQMGTQTKNRRSVSPEVRQRVLDAANAAALAALDAGDHDDDENDGTTVHVHLHGAANDGAGAGLDAEEGTENAVYRSQFDTALKASEDKLNAKIDDGFKKMEDSMKKVMDTLGQISGPGPGGSSGTGPALQVSGPGSTSDGGEEETMDCEGKGKTKDSAALETGFKALLSECEILVPGFKLPTFDAAAARKVTVDAMCGTRRDALSKFGATDQGKVTMAAAGVVDLAAMDCSQVAGLFKGVVAAKKMLNNRSTTGDASVLPNVVVNPVKKMTIADLNAMHAKLHSKSIPGMH